MKTCLDCGTPLRGRRDKKFCTDSCRNAFNNRQNAVTNNLVRNINRRLSKNRRILAALQPMEETEISKEVLQAKGFDFSLHTSAYTQSNGSTCYFCYEQGYVEEENGKLALVVKAAEK